jgi:uncharacterized protein YoxC
MMEHAPEVLAALQTFAAFLEDLGIPGLIALLMLGPIMTAVIFVVLAFFALRQAKKVDEERRQEAKADRDLLRELVEDHRQHFDQLTEKHRAETAGIVRDLGTKHAEVTQFYKDNVELVKSTQRLATDMRDIIVNNTRALEHLTNAMQSNFFCPAVREKAGKN